MLQALFGRARRRLEAARRDRRRPPLRFEVLEDRLVLSLSYVADTTQYPFSAVVQVVTTWPDGDQDLGSGALVDAFHVLTAGHLLYSAADGGWATDVQVFPGRNGNSLPFDSADATLIRTYQSFVEHEDRFNRDGRHYRETGDLGLITLDRRLGDATGTFGYSFLSDAGSYTGLTLNSAGYPADYGYDGQFPYRTAGPIEGVTADGSLLYHDTRILSDYIPGQSGSPLWYDDAGDPYVDSVFVSTDLSATTGYSYRLTETVFDDLQDWIAADPAPTPSATLAASSPTGAGGEARAASLNSIGLFIDGTWYLDTSGNYVLEGNDTYIGFGGLPQDIPVTGDWNGDGTDKVGVFRDGVWYLDYDGDGAYTGADLAFAYGLPGDFPVVGDWDGDGLDEGGIVRPSFGANLWALDGNGNLGYDAADPVFYFGGLGDYPVVGDWAGAGRSEVGVVRGGTWFLDADGDFLFTGADPSPFGYGLPSDLPLVGDWNGDGITNVGVVRDVNGFNGWYLDLNGDDFFTGADDLGIFFGLSTDFPVVASVTTAPLRTRLYPNAATALGADPFAPPGGGGDEADAFFAAEAGEPSALRALLAAAWPLSTSFSPSAVEDGSPRHDADVRSDLPDDAALAKLEGDLWDGFGGEVAPAFHAGDDTGAEEPAEAAFDLPWHVLVAEGRS